MRLLKQAPRAFIDLLVYWFTKCFISVRWNDSLSVPLPVNAGVRQGGILSPFLFAVYIDVIITSLKSAGVGLHICNIFMACFVYADDIVLIANSLTHMRAMLNICSDIIVSLDLCFNVNKSVSMYIGPRFAIPMSR